MIDWEGDKDFDPYGEETTKLIQIILSIYNTNPEDNSNEKEDTQKKEEEEIKETNPPDIQETKNITNKVIFNNEENQVIEEFNIINKVVTVTKPEEEKKDNEIIKGTIKIKTNKKNSNIQIKDNKENKNEKSILFKTSITGRPKNGLIRPIHHSKYDNDNAAKVFITRCKKSIHESNMVDIQIFAKEEKIKNNTIINIKFYEPVINDCVNKGITEKLELFNTSLKTIYDKNNKDVLDNILSIEQEDNDIKIKILNLKFSAKFLLYLEAFLNDEKSITIDGIELELKEFDTLSECFNEREKIYNKESKDKIKKYLEEMIQNKLQIRKKKEK